MMDHISSIFHTIPNDFNFIKSAVNGDIVNAPERDIGPTITRLFMTAIMFLGIGITFFALPIVSSGVSVIGLAIGVTLFVIGHDVFIIAKNFQNEVSYLNPHTTNNLRQNQVLDLVKNLESGTILQFLLTPTSKYWKLEALNYFTGYLDKITDKDREEFRQAYDARFAQ